MELVIGIIAVIVAIALMPVILYTGFIIITVAFGIIMIPFAGVISVIEAIKTKKELAKKSKEFETMKNRIAEANKKFSEHVQ